MGGVFHPGHARGARVPPRTHGIGNARGRGEKVVQLVFGNRGEGPGPRKRFVPRKGFARGLQAVVVINKIDRDGARPDWVLDQTFDLFDRLGATDEQLDFPVIYASALEGYAGTDSSVRSGDMTPLFEAIIKHVQPPQVDVDGPLQMQVSSLT